MPTNRQLFLDHLAPTSDSPLMLEITSAEGVYLSDINGKQYIDLISGIGVSNIGHRHPHVIDAIHKQVDRYLHLMVYGELIQSPQVQLAEALAETLPPHLDSVYLVNSGSEAIEGAMKLAKRTTGRANILSCKNAYHGSTQGALSVVGNEHLKQNFRPLLPGIDHMVFNDASHLNKIDKETAAVVIETVQGEAGVQCASKDYFETLRRRCDETGALLILDEVQCGFGRTGAFWAFEHYNISPDILVGAKGMGGGMPIGCFISDKERMRSLTRDPVFGHISTFGGHPVSSAAALATIEVIKEHALLDEVENKGRLFEQELAHEKIVGVRRKGLMMALRFESYDEVQSIIDKAVSLGVVTDRFLFDDFSMRIAPPLTITPEEIKKACRIILQAIESV